MIYKRFSYYIYNKNVTGCLLWSFHTYCAELTNTDTHTYINTYNYPHTYTHTHTHIYISSSCRAASTDIPDSLSPLLPIVHRLWQVFRATSRILT